MVISATIEAAFLYYRRPEKLSFADAGASLFILFGKRHFISLVHFILKSHVWTSFLVFNLLIVTWPYRLMTMPAKGWWIIPVLIFAVDFLYYWEHRLSHRIRWFWANHAVHHSSEYYNLMMAFRLGWSSKIATNSIFYLPLILAGFRPKHIFLAIMLHQSYQFFLHCEWIPKLGWIEKILVTPSHHRVHHAIDDGFIDRNFGGLLIIYDKMFGTFTEEKGPLRYGLLEPVGSQNPFRILITGWVSMYRGARKQTGFVNVLRYLFSPFREEQKTVIVTKLESKHQHEKVS